MLYRSFIILLFGLMMHMLSGCAHNPYSATNKQYKKQSRQLAGIISQYPLKDSFSNSPYFVGTSNFSLRKPNFVIIHHTAQNNTDETLKTFTLTRTQVSAHYVIGRDGKVYHMLNDYMRAWHAGVSRWGNDADINSSSIGIELDNNGFEPFAEPQLVSLLSLLKVLKQQYNIPSANFIGHADIAPTRKNDPSVYFPWKRLADSSFGNWYDDTSNLTLPSPFNHLQALRIIGYDIRDTAAAITAFKRHWLQDTTKGFSGNDLKVLYQVEKKFE